MRKRPRPVVSLSPISRNLYQNLQIENFIFHTVSPQRGDAFCLFGSWRVSFSYRVRPLPTVDNAECAPRYDSASKFFRWPLRNDNRVVFQKFIAPPFRPEADHTDTSSPPRHHPEHRRLPTDATTAARANERTAPGARLPTSTTPPFSNNPPPTTPPPAATGAGHMELPPWRLSAAVSVSLLHAYRCGLRAHGRDHSSVSSHPTLPVTTPCKPCWGAWRPCRCFGGSGIARSFRIGTARRSARLG